jgi:hypothetical protein
MLKGAGIGALLFIIDGKETWLTAGQAHRRRVRWRTLQTSEAFALQALGEALLPGAASAGIAHFVDHQLSGDPADALLLIRHLDWPGPLTDFYQQGLGALDAAARRRCATPFARCDSDAQKALVEDLWKDQVEDWQGPPPPLFYLAVRSDAVDVVYGTVEGFQKLDIPYLPHIPPRRSW